ncbi:ABC transporter substrate-binding protein [Rhodococcus ruber]|uniref:ABC transporter substrate-binding protein n=1 Tax=Rhodococcus ruber TaxID=1830 RepID=UPI00177EECA1|nr:ABC transporter substrate-binding protein [Rhodococcus ruber]MBD8053812.1 ABC transporter substrate-binding protein [Rhodococcus ruber]
MARRTRLALGAALAVALLAGCGSAGTAPSDVVDPQATLRYATTYGASSFDPHKTRVAQDNIMLTQVYDRLVHRDRDANPIPGLAESWEFSDDGRTLTFRLREGLQFQDGTPLDAQAVRANLERAQEPDSITTTMLAPVEAIETPDPTTVVLRLNGPGTQLVLTLSDLPGMMVSPNAFGTPDKDAALVLRPVGAGRYTVADAQPGASYDFAAWDGYWDPASVTAERFEWEVVTDPQTRINALASGELDIAMATPLSIDPAAAQGLNSQVQTSLNHYVLHFNRTRSEFGKVDVRRALSTAIDRQALVGSALEGHGEAASQNFPQGYFAYNPELADRYTYDERAARETLAAAGLPDGFTFTAGVMNLPENERIAQIVQQQLDAIGVTMQIRLLSPAEMSPVFNRGELDAVLTTFSGRADPSLLLTTYFAPDSPQNPSHDVTPGFAEALAAANAEPDQQARGQLLGEVSATVVDQALMIPLAFSDLGATLTDRVVGYQPYRALDEWGGIGLTAAE